MATGGGLLFKTDTGTALCPLGGVSTGGVELLPVAVGDWLAAVRVGGDMERSWTPLCGGSALRFCPEACGEGECC